MLERFPAEAAHVPSSNRFPPSASQIALETFLEYLPDLSIEQLRVLSEALVVKLSSLPDLVDPSTVLKNAPVAISVVDCGAVEVGE